MKVEVNTKDIKELEKNILNLMEASGKTTQDVLKQQGTLLAVDLTGAHDRSTNGKLSAADGKKHKEDVVQTVFSTYRDAAKAAKYFTGYGADAPKRWMSYLKRKDAKKMQIMADKLNLSKAYGGRRVRVQVWDGGAAHTRRLKGTGIKNTVNLVIDFAKVTAFAKIKEKNVGRAKHGWADAAAMLAKQSGITSGVARIPSYITGSHHSSKGFGRVTGRGAKSVLKISNSAEYGITQATIAGQVRRRIILIGKYAQKLLNAKTQEELDL